MSEEEDAVVASALSFLEEFYASETHKNTPADSPHDAEAGLATDTASLGRLQTPGERTEAKLPNRRRDANRARAAARRELLSLRAQVSALEDELALVRSQHSSTRGVRASRRTEASDGATLAWKDVAGSQLDQRLRSTRENQRLRALVAGKRQVLLGLRRSLLGRIVNEAKREFCILTSELRLPAFNLEVARVMQELSRRVDAAYAHVEAILNPSSSRPITSRGASPYIATEAQTKVVARQLLPFSSSSTGVATWHHLSRVIRPHAMSLFSYRDEGNKATSTVTEYFGMKLTLGASSAEFRVIQTMRRFNRADRQVIVYESVLDPMTFNGERVRAQSFHEQGVIRITPGRQQTGELETPLSCVEVCYTLAPPASTVNQGGERLDVDGLTRFVLQSMTAVTTTNFHKIENILFDDAVRHSKTQSRRAGE